MLREQDIIRNELLSRYEKRNEDMTKELEFYKEQNSELIKRLDEFETSCILEAENQSVIESTETHKMLKDQISTQGETIDSLKKEIRELELSKARQESQRTELEYNLRAKDYNVEIIKNQLENVNTEVALERAQHEKVLKSFNCLKVAYARLKGDQEHSRKGRKVSKSRQKSHLTTPNNNGGAAADGTDLNKSANNLMSVSGLLDISGLSAFIPDEHGNRMSMGAPSDLGQSLIPYLSAEMRAAEAQCDLWSVAEMA
mmetsp:Transcript_20952/g.25744  ORF Transcript_20952/g.25744 Transcript_20952/m.25744 type:complete len:257 (-) Transcript_20952:1536-2306(-)